MQDFYFDFGNNDIGFNRNDLIQCEPCSIQNGTLFFTKSVVDLERVGKGIGFDEVALLVNQNTANELATSCVSQLYSDGAQSASLKITMLQPSGTYQYDLSVIYKQEASNNG